MVVDVALIQDINVGLAADDVVAGKSIVTVTAVLVDGSTLQQALDPLRLRAMLLFDDGFSSL